MFFKAFSDTIIPEDIWNIYINNKKADGFFKKAANTYYLENESYTVKAEILLNKSGIFERHDTITNTSGLPITLNRIRQRFFFDGGEYQVYTQFNHWQTESLGSWQPLNTAVSVFSNSFRNGFGASPFTAIWNEQSERGIAFHLIPNSLWKIETVHAIDDGTNSQFYTELGIYDENLEITLLPGEEFTMPEILFYQFKNKTDMDCAKFHGYLNEKFPRRDLPVIYNSWLCNFDDITYELMITQAELAAKLGVEYFVIDAGWFGNKDLTWEQALGDWFEYDTGKLGGRLLDISNKVRSLGMKFGLWFEPERSTGLTKSVAEHPEYYIEQNGSFFLDFRNPAASEYIFDCLSRMFKKYNVEFVKFDANANMGYDKNNNAFYDLYKSYYKFIDRLHKEFPDLYMLNCAGGGANMHLKNSINFDTFWFSDNQSPFDGMRMFKDTLLRLPPQVIGKWATVTSLDGVIRDYDKTKTERIITCNDATWTEVKNVDRSFLFAFMLGAPLGISCDLSKFSDTFFDAFKEFIADFKNERPFWTNAQASILTDTPSMLVLQYTSPDAKKVKIISYSLYSAQKNIRVYPKLPAGRKYSVGGKSYTSDELSENGISIPVSGRYKAEIIDLLSE